MERSEEKLKDLVLGLKLRLSSLSSNYLSHLTSPHRIIFAQWAL